jgi:hypothetical protein
MASPALQRITDPLPRFFPEDPDERSGADLLDERVCCCEPSLPGAQDRIHRQPEALLGPLGRLVQIASRRVADDENVDVIRRGARDAFVAGGPRPEDRYGGCAERRELLADDELGTERERDQFSQWPGIPAGRVG